MKAAAAAVRALRLLLFAILSWLLVAALMPTPDPFAVMAFWLAVVVVVACVPPARRAIHHWVMTGRRVRGARRSTDPEVRRAPRRPSRPATTNRPAGRSR